MKTKSASVVTSRVAAPLSLKIAYIGGGSRYWAKMIMTDLALCPDFTGELALFDLDHAASRRNVGVAKEIFDHPDARTRFRTKACTSPAEALRGADFVFLSILPGEMKLMANDLDIPAKYGILQSVGDSTGPGGISRSLRTIPIYAHYARLIEKHCPSAWIINYTNPMTLCTRTLYEVFPKIKAIGCCHEVFEIQKRLARLVSEYWEVPVPDRHEIKADIAGINHFTFATRVEWKGRDLFPLIRQKVRDRSIWADQTAWVEKKKAEGAFFTSQGLVSYDFFRRFGVLGAAGDRHLSEFVPWYLESEATLSRYGALMTPSSYRLGTWQPPQNAPSAAVSKSKSKSLPVSGEEGVEMLRALTGIQSLHSNVNFPNRGQMPSLPLGAIVETNALFQENQITPTVPAPLPPALESLVRRVVDVQEVTFRAGLERDSELAFQAILADPLCTIPVDQARKMFDELCKANQTFNPKVIAKLC